MAMDQIHCFIKAYLIKACILMFSYDAPKIWLSRICKAKSHLLHTQLYSMCYNFVQLSAEWIAWTNRPTRPL